MKRPENFNKHLSIIRLLNNEKSIPCYICGKTIHSKSGFGTHLLTHNLNWDEYVFKYFTNITPEFKYHKCGFCSNNALPEIAVDIKNKTYSMSYPDGYMCQSSDCIDQICLKFFNKPYKDAKREYEHIGAKTEFLAQRYNKSIEEVKQQMKHKEGYILPPESRTSLYGYISRYGKKLGTKKYNERCQAISKSQKIEWYINCYGLIEGTCRFNEKNDKIFQATKNIVCSKNQMAIFHELKKQNSEWQSERYCGGIARVDMINKSLGVIVEFFGSYWHCNPEMYSKTFYNKSLKRTAEEQWKRDNERLQNILLRTNSINLIIVIWESSFYKYGLNDIIIQINDIINTNIHTQEKTIKWI